MLEPGPPGAILTAALSGPGSAGLSGPCPARAQPVDSLRNFEFSWSADYTRFNDQSKSVNLDSEHDRFFQLDSERGGGVRVSVKVIVHFENFIVGPTNPSHLAAVV